MFEFSFHPELFDLRCEVTEVLSPRFQWFVHWSSIDIDHQNYGLEVTGIREEETAREILALLESRFSEVFPHSCLYFKDFGLEPGWVVEVARTSPHESDSSDGEGDGEGDADTAEENWSGESEYAVAGADTRPRLISYERLDPGARLVLPEDVIAWIEEASERRVHLVPGADGAIWLYDDADFSAWSRGAKGDLKRLARSVRPDGKGRIPVPEPLRRAAGIERDVAVARVAGNYVLLASGHWAEYFEKHRARRV